MEVVSVFSGLLKGASTANTIVTTSKNVQALGKKISKRELKKKDYYVTKQYKKVVIYRDGFGIVEDSFDFRINNPSKFTHFRRMINIEDGALNNCFPPLADMLIVPVEERRTQQGFWYNTSDAFLSSPVERYWHDTRPNDTAAVDYAAESNPRIIKFEFPVAMGVNTDIEHNLTYSLSIPGMYPISNFKACDKNSSPRSTSISVEYDIAFIKYVVGFEHGFEFTKEPECTVTRNADSHSHENITITVTKVRDNNFYTYYEFEIANVQFRDIICISWELPY